MGSRQNLLVEEVDGELRIDTSDEAMRRIEDPIEESEVHSEIEYLSAVRNVVRYARTPGFDLEREIDEEPSDSSPVDDDQLAIEVEEFEAELEEQGCNARNE